MSVESNTLEVLTALDRINVLSDRRRLEILQLIMVKSRTISQIGRILDEFPAAIRYHIKKLENAGLVELNELRESPGYTEKYYAAKSQAVLLQGIILPTTEKKTIVFMGSNDLAFEKLISGFERRTSEISILNLPVGSLDGLVALRQGAAHISGCHLYDPDSDLFNSPYIKHLFPDQTTKMVTLAHRVQGIIIAAGNPKQISSLEDLARDDIKFVNRNRGSGTRIWLDNKLNELGLNPEVIDGYTQELCSHTGITQEIKLDSADMGIGLIAAAVEEDLDFIPLFEEQFDLVVPESQSEDKDILSMLDFLTTANYRRTIDNLEGYKNQKTGTLKEVKTNIKDLNI
jgi:putative molybdopterin biosynthesis protein